MMAVVGLTASGCVVEAAAAIVAVLGSVHVTRAVSFCGMPSTWWLNSGGHQARRSNCFFLWTASVRPAEQEQSIAASIQIVSEASDLAEPLEANLATQINAKVLGAGMGDLSRVEPERAKSVAGADVDALAVWFTRC